MLSGISFDVFVTFLIRYVLCVFHRVSRLISASNMPNNGEKDSHVFSNWLHFA